MPHRVIVTDELTRAEYRANPFNRCFHCKTSLYEALRDLAASEGLCAHCQRHQYRRSRRSPPRPGRRTGLRCSLASGRLPASPRRTCAHSPPNWDSTTRRNRSRPACPAVFPYGSHIDEERLAQVERAEDALANLGFIQYRVRHHEDVARLEVAVDELPRALELREELADAVTACGYRFVSLDLSGFISGSLNKGLIDTVKVG